MPTSQIVINIDSDEQNIPEKIYWENSLEPGIEEAKAISLGVWDAAGRGSMVFELWNKEMQTIELKGFYLEILKKISDSVRQATDDHVIGNIIDNACFQIASVIESQLGEEK